MNDKKPIDRLIEDSRILGASRIITHDDPAKITMEDARLVTDQVRDFCQRTGRKFTQVARSIGVSSLVLGLALRRDYRGQWQALILDLDRWLEVEISRERAPKPTEFVWTKVAEEIMTVAEAAMAMKCIGLVYDQYGAGIGKTIALQAIASEKPGAIVISIETASATPVGILRLIAKSLRLTPGPSATAGAYFAVIKKALADSDRLLMVDEIHKLCSRRDDNGLHVLRDLHDATGIPMLWCGTMDLVAHLERKSAASHEPLAQIRRRIGIARDLRERVGDGGGPGEPLFTVEEIRRVFAKSKMRLTPDAGRYLCWLANLPDAGGLGACRNLVVMASKVNEKHADALTADMLRSVHRLLVNRSAFELLERRMDNTHAPLVKVG